MFDPGALHALAQRYLLAGVDQPTWLKIGMTTGLIDEIRSHDRLLRSLRFGDDDYPLAIFDFMKGVAVRRPDMIEPLVRYADLNFVEGEIISTAPVKERKLIFAPEVFQIPDVGVDRGLCSLMTPFAVEMEPVFQAVNAAAGQAGLYCLRAKDIWENTAVIQDVFSLIFRSQVVVCDFTGKNPNVFYEAGIAHTLGKHVVPITQSADDIPFDLRHHRYLVYLNNGEGCSRLTAELSERLRFLRA